MTQEEERLRLERFKKDEDLGKSLRTHDLRILNTQVEVRNGPEREDWWGMNYAYDTIHRAILAANQAGFEGRRITRTSTTGCTTYGNLTIGWDEESAPK